MDIKVRLRGWADGLSDNPKKIYFPLQCAMYEVIGDCDWHFKVNTKGKSVNKPWKILVRAKRCHSRHFNFPKKINKGNFTHINFSFEVPQYTIS